MKNILLVIENDTTLENADYTRGFMRTYIGEVIEMTRFNTKSRKEIFENVSKCTDIAVQTCFINGSDSQLDEMVGLLAKIPHTINVYIAYIGSNDKPSELHEYFVNNLTPTELLSIEQHNVFSMGRNVYESLPFEPHTKLDFTPITRKIHKAKTNKRVHELYLEHYRNTAQTRPTGRKVLVIGCTANGTAFKNLPIGKEVDELECGDLLTSGKPPRGVWIWGNGEPIMLVNDVGFREYQITTKQTSGDILAEIGKVISLAKDIKKLNKLKLLGLVHIIEDKEETAIGKANLICELLKIEKRGNRQNIYLLLQQNLELA